MFSKRKNILFLFDVNNTISLRCEQVTDEIKLFLANQKKKVYIGIISGMDYNSLSSTMNTNKLEKDYDYCFCQNATSTYIKKKLVSDHNIMDKIDQDVLNDVINFSLKEMSDIDIPIKRDKFININKAFIELVICGKTDDNEINTNFRDFDEINRVREELLFKLREKFANIPLQFVLGENNSIYIYPNGWDKRFCLQYVEKFDEIHYFTNNLNKEFDSYDLFHNEKIINHYVKNPSDMMIQVRMYWLKENN